MSYSTELLEEAQDTKNYFDFSSGVPIEETRVNRWIREVIESLTETESCHSSHSCGNTAVVGVKYGGDIQIYVMTKYKSFTLYPSEEEGGTKCR